MSSVVPIYTIGYGLRTIDDFLQILEDVSIEYLIDVRSVPYSRRRPEFSRPQLEQTLRHTSLRYVFMGDTLGGRPADTDCYVNGKVDYDTYSQKPAYLAGIARLQKALDQQRHVAIMCSEARPADCHRTKLIGETLSKQGVEVVHIDEEGQTRSHHEIMSYLINTPGNPPPLFDLPHGSFTSRKRYRHDRTSEDEEL